MSQVARQLILIQGARQPESIKVHTTGHDMVLASLANAMPQRLIPHTGADANKRVGMSSERTLDSHVDGPFHCADAVERKDVDSMNYTGASLKDRSDTSDDTCF